MLPPIAGRFVAGETEAEAIAHAEALNERNVGAIVNLLGEHYERPERAAADRDTYRQLARDLSDAGLRARLSVKPTQLGLECGEEVFRKNAHAVVEAAADADVFVWFDMEHHGTTDATLDVYRELAETFGDVGVCLQANLRRTREDLESIASVPGGVRLVKGAYDEPESVAYTHRRRVDAELRELVRYAVQHCEGVVGLGSHDPAQIEHAIALGEEYGRSVELQLLMGVRERTQYDLAADHDVWQYVPYGDRWLRYFYRRLSERRENALFALRAIVGR